MLDFLPLFIQYNDTPKKQNDGPVSIAKGLYCCVTQGKINEEGQREIPELMELYYEKLK